ncbi:glycoside hydrolase family 38 C-terminal domain-containing protein [Promicromonospora xylanilytica]
MPSHAYMTPSPVWDASLYRSKILDYAADQVVAVEGHRLGLVAEPLLRTDPEHGRQQVVRLQWLDEEAGTAPDLTSLPVDVTIDGSAVGTGRRPVGPSGVRLLVPAVDEPGKLVVALPTLGVRLEHTLEPQRHWEVHLIHHSHLDIGYTDPQAVVREQHLGYLDDVLRIARETDDRDDDARFRWSEEALYSVTDWLDNRTEQQRAELVRRVQEGRISLSAMPFNLHTEMCSTDELYELLRPARDLRQRYGLRFRSAMQTDVPGAVVGLPDALSALGVEYLSVAHNWAGRSAPDETGAIDLPRLFRWQGPQGGSVVVWRTDSPHGMAYMEGPTVGFHESYELTSNLFPAYLSSLAKRPYPLMPGSVFGWLDTTERTDRQPYPWDVLHLRVHGSWSDNAGPSRTISDVVAEWNAEWDFPRLRLSTNEDFFDAAVERVGDELQTFVGDWNDWWAHGVGAAAAPVSVGRTAQARLRDAQTLSAAARLITGAAGDPLVDPERGYAQLALWDEHTWGASNSWEHADLGSSSGEHQWYWKVARAYEALDEAEHGLHVAGATLAEHLGSTGDASVYLLNTSGQPRTEAVELFLPASVTGLDRSVTVTDSRTGAALDHDERVEEQRSRGIGRHVRTTVADVPAVGLVRLDLTSAPATDVLRRRAAAASGDLAFENAVGEPVGAERPRPADELVLDNEHLRVELDQRDGTVSSILDKRTGREMVNTDAALGFNAYVYDRYATNGHSNHNSSKFADSGNLGLLSSREIGGPVAVVDSGSGAVDSWVRVASSRVPGGESLVTTYRLRHDRAQLDIVNRLAKSDQRDKESAFFAFPFAAAEPRLLQESAGGLSGRDADRVPGGGEYLTAIRHWIAIDDLAPGSAAPAIGWATADVPLVETGHIALPYVPFPNTMPDDEPATIYSWVHNNIWDTNFPVEQTFEMDFRYTVLFGEGEATAVAATAAESLVHPLRAVFGAGDGAPVDSLSLLEVEDPRVRLVGLQESADGSILVRLFCTSPDGARTAIRLPDGVTSAHRSSYWGDRAEPLEIADGRVELEVANGAAALTLG